MAYETIRYGTSHDGVATLTLNRPDVLNAFDRRMCEEVRDAWQRVKDDPAVGAVVLRAAGDRAFCAGLDTKVPFGQPDDVWNHLDPGEFLSPKWQQVWKPVVCAVHGMCTAGAFYFVNESDIVICSDDATFFDSHVTYGFVSALEPVGLMRKVGLGEALRIALSGNDERVTAETALRIGLVTEVVPRAALWGRAHEIAQGIACKPRAATEGGVAGWNLADHERFWAAKRGSVGRAHPGCELRVVDARSGAPLAPDDEGLLEVKTLQLGDDPEWVRTTDVARIDTDGFVYILGRADQAIIRGGFKVRPEDVRAALERDPRVRGAAVVSRPDARLGAVPVAAVELRPGSGPVPEGELLTEAAKVLARYELPDELRLVEALPRTPAGKVDLAAVRELFTTEPA